LEKYVLNLIMSLSL